MRRSVGAGPEALSRGSGVAAREGHARERHVAPRHGLPAAPLRRPCSSPQKGRGAAGESSSPSPPDGRHYRRSSMEHRGSWSPRPGDDAGPDRTADPERGAHRLRPDHGPRPPQVRVEPAVGAPEVCVATIVPLARATTGGSGRKAPASRSRALPVSFCKAPERPAKVIRGKVLWYDARKWLSQEQQIRSSRDTASAAPAVR